ncbi:endonuclease NucS domain-containing protein [Brevibacillus sp. NPDC058079]|uniref:endonuclease NucS domain-containing protein n=1 Tax=Brevibacillus sp. NPDC058079 TaxID=3346330 RepID=UPI0036E6AFDB
MNYESEFQELMIQTLRKQYGIEDDTVLYHYFALRFFISRQGKNFEKNRIAKEMVLFLCEELNLPKEETFIYKGETMKKGIALENSLQNIMESWNFENSIRFVSDGKGNHLSMDQYLIEQQQAIIRYAINKAKSYKKSKEYGWYWKHHALCYLNRVYNVTTVQPNKIEGVVYPDSHDMWIRTMEQIGEAWVHVSEYQRQDTKTITEQDVEDYLFSRLNLVEEGMVYIDRQFSITDGRIDILARDKNGTYCIIELKVSDDKELVWQCLYYPTQIKKKFGVSKVRMITLAPSYSNSLLVTLEQIGYVEILSFVPKVRLGKIEELSIREVPHQKIA